MPRYLTLDQLNLKGKRVLVRLDLNVPMKDGKILDTSRIDRVAPTLTELIDQGSRIIIISHLGRPEGRDPKFSLFPLKEALSDCLYGIEVRFVDDCIGPKVENAIQELPEGAILLLENLRFHKGEEKNDLTFAQSLAKLGDFYINDAFASVHRAHASVEKLPHLMPVSAIGRLMEGEIDALSKVLDHPERPVMAIVGGSKVSTKLALLNNLLQKTDKLVVGGGMANTLLLAQGVQIGTSLCETDMVAIGRDILETAHVKGCELILPSDVIMAPSPQEADQAKRYTIDHLPSDQMILDIGPTTTRAIITHLKECATLVWNGPLGLFETPPFDISTREIAQYVAERTQEQLLLSIAGGGDTISALSQAGVMNDFSYVSTAGGAFLEWLEGKTLPGLKALDRPEPEGPHCPLHLS